MDAPAYPPAVAFEQPAAAQYVLSTETASLAELMSSPTAWAIVVKHAPFLEFAVKSVQIQPHLGNFTLDMFLSLGMTDQKTIDAVDQELAQLPRSEWPAQ
jgi:hypothetical protein